GTGEHRRLRAGHVVLHGDVVARPFFRVEALARRNRPGCAWARDDHRAQRRLNAAGARSGVLLPAQARPGSPHATRRRPGITVAGPTAFAPFATLVSRSPTALRWDGKSGSRGRTQERPRDPRPRYGASRLHLPIRLRHQTGKTTCTIEVR